MYKTKDLEAQINNSDADTKKRFGLIKTLSRNFTVSHDTALEMDRLISEQIGLEAMATVTPKAQPKPSPKSSSKSTKPNSETGLKAKFGELFEAIQNHAYPEQELDANEVQKLIQRVLSGRKIQMADLDQSVRKLLDSTPQVISYDIPGRKPQPFSKPNIPAFQKIVDDVIMGNNVMLIGGAGTGKTYMAENLVAKAALGRQHITINCSQWTSPTEIIGGQTMDGYVEGKLIEAWSKGMLLVLDELPKMDPNTAGLLNDALAKTKVPNAVIFNSRKESFPKHADFACIATGNIYPNKESLSYGANNKQDLSLLDRFSGSVYFIEKNPEIERQVVGNDMIWSICNEIRSAIEELKYEAQMSLRFMANARDTYNLEMSRVKDGGKNGLKADEGKTLQSAVDSYLSTFTGIQSQNIKTRISYNQYLSKHQYRKFSTAQLKF